MAMTPPVAPQKPHTVVIGKPSEINESNKELTEKYMKPIEYQDEFYWLRDDTRQNEEILQYLTDENKFTAEHMKDTEELQRKLYKNIKQHIKETDVSFPVPLGQGGFDSPYRYFTKTFEGSGYAQYWRQNTETKEETLLLDVNELAKDQPYCDVDAPTYSYDHKYMVYGVDTKGNEYYDMFVVDMDTMEQQEHKLGTLKYGNYTMLKYSNHIIYTEYDKNERGYQIVFYDFVNQTKTVLYQEDDIRYSVGSYTSSDTRFLFIQTCTSESYETYYIRLNKGELDSAMTKVVSRDENIKYHIIPWYDNFLITSNKDNKASFKLFQVPISDPSVKNWKRVETTTKVPKSELVDEDNVITSSDSVDLDYVSVFKNFATVYLTLEDRDLLYIVPKTSDNQLSKEWYCLSNLENNLETLSCNVGFFDSNRLWVSISTPQEPTTLYQTTVSDDYTKLTELEFLWRKEIPNYDSSTYSVKKVYVIGHDGVKIPVSIYNRKDLQFPAPCYLYGYGAYGMTIGTVPVYSLSTLLDAGFCYVIAHVRGSAMRGEKWHLAGKMHKKMNTFLDFISVAEYLKNENICLPNKLAIEGRSAGGLLIGAVYTMRPDLFDVAVAGVPFVDVITTMSDETIPLTTGEWLEWGNPNIEEDYKYMIKYSPYDNLKTNEKYPPILILAGLNDPRVQYWEPAKFMARLRHRCAKDEQNNEINIHMMKTEMDKGHFGNTDRYAYIKEKAHDYAFVIKTIFPDTFNDKFPQH